MVLVVVAGTGAEIGEIVDERDGDGPFHRLEAQLASHVRSSGALCSTLAGASFI